ncbi:bacteriocin maturation protein [Paenibacillus psychroresistens]|uniref:Bacteriocin maturation protein n=1 Tax=Paenibacillus psychroresistens TaxID=1778678 RepID=A0A6B8RMM0_9BACL|nr:bacteriocin maturation protein [Paenibacillus psychroresistens]QGQ96598.1 bacteriocin maturation protein [Paenibacillus psychroresistens]
MNQDHKVLAVGCGPFLLSLIASLLESGLCKFHVLITDSVLTDRQRLAKLVEQFYRTDPETSIEEIPFQKDKAEYLHEVIKPFQTILYVSQEGDIKELRSIHTICREEKKMFISAICIGQSGLVGPMVKPGVEGCWESSWRRIHRTALYKKMQLSAFSSAAGALLANIIVFELLKAVMRATESELKHNFFLLDMDTLEGDVHFFVPHPLVNERVSAKWVLDINQRVEQDAGNSDPDVLLQFFYQMTSAVSGIFQIWEEGDLTQLPLSQCRVQVADLLSEGPADLMNDIVCSEFTHKEARREAGLVGVEAYISRMTRLLVTSLHYNQKIVPGMIKPQEFVAFGAGETFAEGVCRGLQKCLNEELIKRHSNQTHSLKQVQLDAIEDKQCEYYWNALSKMQATPKIGLGENVFGFPVLYVGSGGYWYSCVGLNMTIALRNAMKQALRQVQNQTVCFAPQGIKDSLVDIEKVTPLNLVIRSFKNTTAQSEVLQTSLSILALNNKHLYVFDLELEPFLKNEPVKVFGMLLREDVC